MDAWRLIRLRRVVGSNPTSGANFICRSWLLMCIRCSVHSKPGRTANFLDVNQNLHTAIDVAATEWEEHISNHAV